ncbi:MAG: hypothetical protein WAN46_05350 [Gammaproteobacteria bacterium]
MGAKGHLENGECLGDRAQKLSYADIEHEFWHNGYDSFIDNMVTSNSRPAEDRACYELGFAPG